MAVPPTDPTSSASTGAAKLPSSSHRLPTVSASEALQGIIGNDKAAPNAQTGVSSLDDALGDGLENGKVTELWGPMGAGKTAIALQTASNVLQHSGSVLWIDCAASLSVRRLYQAVPKGVLSRFHHGAPPTLAHLLALLLHPTVALPPEKCRLLVISNLQTAVEAAHPRHATFPANTKADTQKWAAGRRYAILGSIVSALNKLAATHDIAVLVTTGCATRMRSDYGGPLGLVPGVGGGEWEAGIWTRAAVFQDFGNRFVGVQKLRGSNTPANHGDFTRLAVFAVSEKGLAVAAPKEAPGGPYSSPTKTVGSKQSALSRKRNFEEVADSDDEEGIDEYGGWTELEENAMDGAEAEIQNKTIVLD